MSSNHDGRSSDTGRPEPQHGKGRRLFKVDSGALLLSPGAVVDVIVRSCIHCIPHYMVVRPASLDRFELFRILGGVETLWQSLRRDWTAPHRPRSGSLVHGTSARVELRHRYALMPGMDFTVAIKNASDSPARFTADVFGDMTAPDDRCAGGGS